MITQAELRDRLSYDPEMGIFIWIRPGWNKTQFIGKRAGGFDGDGYIGIKIDGIPYKAHNLAWLYVHGAFPAVILDHKDGVKDNNALANLREASFAGNSQNQRKAHKDSAHGLMGADFIKGKNRFRARIQINGRRIALGGFATAEAAHEAYLKAKRAFHQTCTI